MTNEELTRLFVARDTYNATFNQYEDALVTAGYALLTQVRQAWETFMRGVFPPDRCRDGFASYTKHNWPLYAQGVELDEDTLQLHFVQNGAWGERDEWLHSMTLVEDLLTPEGRARLAAAYAHELNLDYEDYRRVAAMAEANKIAKLEAELAKLKGK